MLCLRKANSTLRYTSLLANEWLEEIRKEDERWKGLPKAFVEMIWYFRQVTTVVEFSTLKFKPQFRHFWRLKMAERPLKIILASSFSLFSFPFRRVNLGKSGVNILCILNKKWRTLKTLQLVTAYPWITWRSLLGPKGSNDECTKELNASQGLFGLHTHSCGINSDFVFLQYTSFRDPLIILYSYFILIVPAWNNVRRHLDNS